MGKLTIKQSRFVELYVLYGNASRAAEEAGYSAKTAYSIGDENLKKPVIAQAIAAKQAILAEIAENRLIDRQQGAMEVFRRTMKSEAYETALRANDQLIRLGGFYKAERRENVNINLKDMTMAELHAEFARLTGVKAVKKLP